MPRNVASEANFNVMRSINSRLLTYLLTLTTVRTTDKSYKHYTTHGELYKRGVINILLTRVGFLPAETCFCRASGLNRQKLGLNRQKPDLNCQVFKHAHVYIRSKIYY